ASLAQRLLHAQRLRDHDARDPFVEVFTFTSGYPWTAADLKEAFFRWVLAWPMMRAVFLETPEGLRLDFPPIDETRLVRVASVTHLPNLDRRRATDALIDEFASAPIDLALGPLAQVLIVETGGGETQCALRASRLAVDQTMVSHLRESYLRACHEVGGGRPRHRAEVDHAALAAAHARDDAAHAAERARAAAFWATYLPDERVPMTLPTRVTSGTLRYQERRGDWTVVPIQPPVVTAARTLAEKHGVTLGDVLEACFVALLSRYSDAETIVLREYTARDSAVGTSLATVHGQLLPLVFEVTPTTPFSTLIDQVPQQRQRVREGAANLLFDAVVAPNEHGRDKIDLLTQAGFRYVRYISADGEARPQIRDFAIHQRFRPPVDLLLSVDEFADDVLVSLAYCLDLFDPRVIDDVVAHYASLLRGFVHAAQQPLSVPRLLSDEEEHRIVHDWNQTAKPYPHDRSLADLVFHTCETHADRVATVDAHRSLTYRELAARAEALAARLADLGARRGDHVVLLQDRSADVITAIVACVSAGLAYVPLEPDYPKARVEALCAQCGAVAIVADPALAGLAPEGIPVITDLDTPHEMFGRIRRPVSQPTDIAYVLFTSGSTGVPKAAQVTQRGVVNLVTWLIGEFGFDERDRVMLKTPYSHDISVPEIFIPLLTGGCVVV
ncbi:MAG: hypothetical protein EB084_24345, partial [Proteobacteria bacterium]|nr:hypothetical protein [Pseudomonadota bacterium]